MATNINCACPAGAAREIQDRLLRAAPSSGIVACVKASSSATMSANCPISGIILLRFDLWERGLPARRLSAVLLVHQGLLHLCLVDRLARLGRHIVFIVLRQYCLGVENAVNSNMTLGDAATSFFKKIRQNTFIDYGNARSRVGDNKVNRKAVVISFKTTILNQAANSECSIRGCFFGSDLRRTEEKHQVVFECVEYQEGGDCKARQSRQDKEDSLMTSFHRICFLEGRSLLVFERVSDAIKAAPLRQ